MMSKLLSQLHKNENNIDIFIRYIYKNYMKISWNTIDYIYF